MQAERVQFWLTVPRGKPRHVFLERYAGAPPEIQERGLRLRQLHPAGVVKAWPDVVTQRRTKRLLTVATDGRLLGPLARRPKPPIKLEWVPLLEELERRRERDGVPQRDLALWLRGLGWTPRQVRCRLRRLDRQGLVEALEDNERWRLTLAGRRALVAVREHVEVWGV